MYARIPSVIVSLLAITGARAKVVMDLYSDGDCANKIGSANVDSGTCMTWFTPGWSSAKITDDSGSPAGTLTFYTNNNCAAGQSKHGYSAANFDCLRDFGFVANAAGLAG
ncbi:hypothetical protein Daus18300_012163 [Diaporthe australafricana]|uniref:Uncharacterized protein n=1 Tax=Diaporthe australafricana TaxID=127596 RepID=A0ABR3W3S2_9PEZI